MKEKNLTPQLLAEAKNYPTAEERMAYLRNSHIRIPDEVLDSISGGSSSGYYECSKCHEKFENFFDALEHAFNHVF